MTKSRFLILAVVVFALVGWFFYQNEKLNESRQETVQDTDVTAGKHNSSLTPPSLKIESPKTPAESGTITESKEYQNAEEKFEAFDRMEAQWLEKAKEIIGDENFQTYLQMREQGDREKLKAYKEYHNYLRQKYGDNFSYNISDDQSINEKKINQKYLNDLLKLIGPEKFKQYLAAKDQFNEEMRRQNIEAIQVEF